MTPNDKPLTPQQARQRIQKGLTDYLAGKSQGPIVFRLKRSKRAYPLKLTRQQREVLLQFTQLSRNLKNNIKQAAEGTQIVRVTWSELHKLHDETGQAAVYARGSDRIRLMAVHRYAVKFFEEEYAEVFDPSPIKTDRIFQFKITLLDIEPAIWRRITVPDCTLNELHQYIQEAFGWEDYHLHLFEIGGVKYSQPDPSGDDFGMEYQDEAHVVLSKLIRKSSQSSRWIYEYDFGDDWQHEVLFEGFPPADPRAKYPLCLDGARACPPEDCGGPWGYADYLASMADPQNEQHEEMMNWRGPFDPEAFDAKKSTKRMRRIKR